MIKIKRFYLESYISSDEFEKELKEDNIDGNNVIAITQNDGHYTVFYDSLIPSHMTIIEKNNKALEETYKVLGNKK